MPADAITVSGLGGRVQYVPSSPFAVGDPVFSVDEHIRIDSAADVVELDGRRILYQEYHLYDVDQVPGYNEEDTDAKDAIGHYVNELRQLVNEYPTEVDALTALETRRRAVTVHGELLGEYGGEHETEVAPLLPRERREIRRRIMSLERNGDR